MRAAFDAAEKKLRDARNHVIEKKAECKRKMSLKCDKCKNLKCKQAERNCKGFLDAAGKWIGGVVNAAGEAMPFFRRFPVIFPKIFSVRSHDLCQPCSQDSTR